MKNSEFKNLLERLNKAQEKYQKLLNQAEQEYEIKYDSNPCDNDYWVDTFHGEPNDFDFKKLNQHAIDAKNN